DAYVDAIFRMLRHLTVPRRAVIGPWGHQWPHAGRPGPAMGFLQEAVPPKPSYVVRPGRWVAEPSWPRHGEMLALTLNADGLRDRLGCGSGHGDGSQRGDVSKLTHCSPQTVGLQAGAWCAYGNPADLPLDQRRDDALSLSLDGRPLTERIEIFGAPQLRLRVASDRPVAFAAARLCDVAPDGGSTLITRGVLNLCHRTGHDQPQPLAPGEPIDVTLALKSVAYAVPAGHRLRLAISTSYWPWLWPSPSEATVTIFTGAASVLRIPTRAPRDEDRQVAFDEPETAPALPVVWLRARSPRQRLSIDQATGEVALELRRDFSGGQRLPSGLEFGDCDPVLFTIREGDPLSARVSCERRIDFRRDDWRARVEVRAEMTATAAQYLVSTTIDAYEGDTRIHNRMFTAAIPRNHT
ncbi:MAG: CocE/NonD family hydrolase C-terminal non-catalytic domain-containing protein, partial [Solirubrobacteraceae bacterium]